MIGIDLRGKAALVTGGARGIGRAAALALAEAGADVAIGYHRHEEAAQRVLPELQSLGARALAVSGDLSRRSNCGRVFQRTLNAFSRIDIVVVNAGIWKEAPIDRMTARQLEDTLSVNLKSAFFLCQLAVRQMKKQGGGNIILVSSTAGQRGEAFYSHYAASKGALIALTKSLAAEVGPAGIRVNCVAPGWVATDMTSRVFRDSEYQESVRLSIPLQRIAAAEEIAGPILFLASDLSSHVHGEVLNVNGGSVLCG